MGITTDPALDTDLTAPEPKKGSTPKSILIQNNGTNPIADPYTSVQYAPGKPVEVPRISTWLQYQIDAGLFIKI